MTPKEKYQDIDLSKLPEKAVEQLEKVKPFLFEAKYESEENKEVKAKGEQALEKLYTLISEKYPESIKSKQAKAPEPKTPQAIAKKVAKQSIKQPAKGKSTASAKPTKRGEISRLAKEIRKEGERFQDAMKRAGEMIQAEKKKAVTNANKQYKKLSAFLKKNPIPEGSTTISRDAPRKALPAGKRTSKNGNTYYEYRQNRTDKHRKRYPYLALGGKLHGAGMFEGGGKYAKGGRMNYLFPQKNTGSSLLFDLEYGDVFEITRPNHTATHQYFVFLELSDAYNVSLKVRQFPALKDNFGNKETYITGVSDGDIRILSREEAGKKLLEYQIKNEKFAKGGEMAAGGNTARPLYEIAQEIRKDWRPIYFGAKPYLDAMSSMDSVNDNYGFDSGRSIVNYFLANAQSWRGDTAKRIKAELKSMLKYAEGGGISDSDREKSIAELKKKIKHFREVEKSEPMARYYEEALFYMTEGKENDILKRGKYAKGGHMAKGGELNNLMPHSKTHKTHEK